MTTLAPVLDLVGDIGEFSAFNYAGARWIAYLRQSGELELHRVGDGITEFIGIDVPFPKRQVSVAVLGDELCVAWTHGTTQEVYFSKWHMGTRAYTQQPTALWPGSSPALARFRTDRLAMSYLNAGGAHVFRTSIDAGVTWDAVPIVVDPSPVSEVGIDVYPATDNKIYWADKV